jgi:hypothetical protein
VHTWKEAGQHSCGKKEGGRITSVELITVLQSLSESCKLDVCMLPEDQELLQEESKGVLSGELEGAK